jgi:environmental stress-induced protein Ves
MIHVFLKSGFKKMLWKNGQGVTSQIYIYPESASLDKNDFLFRLSSAKIERDGPFSAFAGKQRLLTPVKGAGFELNSKVYEKFEIARFSGDEKINCSLLKGPVLDFGIIFDPKLKVQSRILILKSDFTFSLEPQTDYFFTVLDGEITHDGKPLSDLDTLYYHQESFCRLHVAKNAVLYYFSCRSN